MQTIRIAFSLIAAVMISGRQMCVAQGVFRDQGFFKNLLQDSIGIFDLNTPHFTVQPSLQIEGVPFQKMGTSLKYTRNQNGLYVFVEGTGRVYQIKNEYNNLKLSRIDSTVFFGYNFGSYEFLYRDTLFSYGGYGYWQLNGHLRYFIPNKGEWGRTHLSKEVPARNVNGEKNNIWVDVYDGKLYVINASNQTDSIYTLDLSARQWKTLGVSLLSENFTYVLSTPWGALGLIGNGSHLDYMLFNFKLNEVKQLHKSKNESLNAQWSSDTKVYIKDSTIYLSTKSNPDTLIKIKLSKNDFVSTGKKIYEKIPKKTALTFLVSTLENYWIISFGLVLSFGIGAMASYQYLKSKSAKMFMNGNESSNRLSKVFDEKEKELINLVLNNSINNTPTSIEAINHILGIGKKPHDLQKKHRSDTQSSINNKYRYATGRTENLLVSKRTEYDKRSFEYFIEKSKISETQSILNI